jgi:hypothetical protein
MNNFPKFWYESNACWGWVTSIEELQEKCDLQTDKHYGALKNKDEFLDKSYQNDNGSLDFGTRIEHTGKLTLRQFLKENNIDF